MFRLTKQLEQLAKQMPAIVRIRSIPGIGLLSATAVVSFVGDMRRFASGPTMTYRLIKDALRASERNELKTQLALEANLQRKAGASEDAREGVTAFREKRAPRYQGR